MIVVRQLSKRFGERIALAPIDLTVRAGETVALVGPNGAGKSTLVNLISGVDHLSEGELWVGDVAVHRLNEDQAAGWRGRNLGVIYQSFQLMPTLTLADNILLAMDFNNPYRGRRSVDAALDLLREVELEEHAWKLPGDISGGQQQRVAIARALANDPAILVADEPTGRLDSTTAETIFRIFEDLVAHGHTIIMVSHDPSFISRYSRVLWIAEGLLTDEPQFEAE